MEVQIPATEHKAQQLLLSNQCEQLAHHESVIEKGIGTFYEVGCALLAIRDNHLYSERYSTWKEYLDKRWDFTRQRAEQLMKAVSVVDNVATIATIQNEAQARQLAKHLPEVQRVVARLVIASAPEGKITASRIERMGEILAEAVKTNGTVDIGNGHNTPLSAALTAMEYEAVQRQREHIKQSIEGKRKASGYETVVDNQKVPVAGQVINDCVTFRIPGIGAALAQGEMVRITIVREIKADEPTIH